MYDVKIEELRVEILENTKGDEKSERSIWMCFCRFVGTWIKALFKLFLILFRGLWRFAKFGYYNFMAWIDNLDKKD